MDAWFVEFFVCLFFFTFVFFSASSSICVRLVIFEAFETLLNWSKVVLSAKNTEHQSKYNRNNIHWMSWYRLCFHQNWSCSLLIVEVVYKRMQKKCEKTPLFTASIYNYKQRERVFFRIRNYDENDVYLMFAMKLCEVGKNQR